MTPTRIIWSAVAVLLLVLVVLVARNTEWVDVAIPMPPKGEALTNPMYAAQRFAEALGARTTRDQVFAVPARDAVIVLSDWHWSLVRARRDALTHWVESGGRLVVDSLLVTTDPDFVQWSGIRRKFQDTGLEPPSKSGDTRCRPFDEAVGEPSRSAAPARFSICDVFIPTSLANDKPVVWALRDASGMQVMRVAAGRGTVTVINATPFRSRSLFDGDHGRLFVAATQLHRDDEVHFVSEDNSPMLLALVWRWGAPVVILSLLGVVLLIWRGAPRLGPLEVPAPAERRSLAEQIRGTGEFALRHGDGRALHAASVRALEEAARRRIHGYAALSAKERGAALERLSGLDATGLLSAAYHPRSYGPHELRAAIALVETARRHMLVRMKRS
jgi:hypothetical protein